MDIPTMLIETMMKPTMLIETTKAGDLRTAIQILGDLYERHTASTQDRYPVSLALSLLARIARAINTTGAILVIPVPATPSKPEPPDRKAPASPILDDPGWIDRLRRESEQILHASDFGHDPLVHARDMLRNLAEDAAQWGATHKETPR